MIQLYRRNAHCKHKKVMWKEGTAGCSQQCKKTKTNKKPQQLCLLCLASINILFAVEALLNK